MFKEFKEFAVRGNVVDMAVGILIAAGFGTIVKSLVDDLIMPPIGLLLGGVDFSDLFLSLKGGTYASLAAAKEAGAPVIAYGQFINNIISFVVVAWAVFLLVKAMNNFKKKQEAAPAAPPAPTKDQVLLTEIRDLLKK